MGKRWGRKSSQITPDEKHGMGLRYQAGELLDCIARDYGVSPGQVSTICIRELGLPPRIKRRPKGEAAPAAERGVQAFEFNGMVVRRDGELMCLTDLWRAAGSPERNRPADWLRFRGRVFVEHAQTVMGHHDLDVSTGRAGSTWANKHVALAYATDLNPALRLHVQEVFFAYTDGRLTADNPETEAVLDATQAAAVRAAPELMGLIAQMPATITAAIVAELTRNGTLKRRDLTADTKRQHMETVARFFGGMCPCCRDVAVMQGNERLPGSHFDHWTDNAAKNRPDQTWLVCAACNTGFQTRALPRENCRIEWDYYQKCRAKLVRQGSLDVFRPD